MLRIKISLDKSEQDNYIPKYYGSILAEQVQKVLKESDGFSGLFNISSLDLDKTEKAGKKILHYGKSADFILSIYDFGVTESDVVNLFKDRIFFLPNEYQVVFLKTLEIPEFKRKMSYKALSPISVSQIREYDGKTEYFFPGDIFFEDLLFDRIYTIYLLTGGERMDVSKCKYFQDSPIDEKKLTLKKGSKVHKIKAFLQDFTIVAPPKIQEILFFAGVGKLAEDGFGCVGVIDEEEKLVRVKMSEGKRKK